MKRILSWVTGAGGWFFLAGYLWAQDTTPRGPLQWTARNWLGFFIQIGLFILAVIGIYKLANIGGDLEEQGSGEGEEQEKK